MQDHVLHLTEDEVEDFVRKALSGAELALVEEHLLVCDSCRRRVEELDRFVADLRAAVDVLEPLDVIHATADGPIRLRTRQLEDGTWLAEMSGREIHSARMFPTSEQARIFGRRVFCEMFPEHVCNQHCGDAPRE
jgi:anti-sigma factor RsiW